MDMKIAQDPEWFLSLLSDAKKNLPTGYYQKYFNAATVLYEEDRSHTCVRHVLKSMKKVYADPIFGGILIFG